MVELPDVSVIMPIRNEVAFIHRSLESVLLQDYPENRVQVIVVDGMSDDGTRQMVRDIVTQRPARRIDLLDNPQQIVPTGFNRALEHASGDIIVRVDGHCEIASDYVRRCVDLLDKTGADNVGGRQEAHGSGVIASAIALATSSAFGVGNASFHYSNEAGWADTVYLGAWPREVFDRLGGFDEDLIRNQDDEFNFRLTQSGGKIWFDPSIRSVYYNRPNLQKLWRQYFEYGFYKVRVIQKRGAVPSRRHLVPAAFVSGVVLTLTTSLITRDVAWALVALGPYAFVNILASLAAGSRDWRCLPVLPLAFSILHFAYGTGFLKGLWRWRKHWHSTSSSPTVTLDT